MTTDRPIPRGHELEPRDVIADVLEELLIPDPAAVAVAIIQRLRDSGFEITPINKREG